MVDVGAYLPSERALPLKRYFTAVSTCSSTRDGRLSSTGLSFRFSLINGFPLLLYIYIGSDAKPVSS